MKDLLKKQIRSYSGTNIAVHDYDNAFDPFELENVPLKQNATLDIDWLSCNNYAMISRYSDSDISQHGKSVESAFSIYLPSPEAISQQDFLQQPEGEYQSFIAPPGGVGRWAFTGGVSTLIMAVDIDAAARVMSKDELHRVFDSCRSVQRNSLNPKNLQQVSQQLQNVLTSNELESFTEQELNEKLDYISMQTFLLATDSLTKASQGSKRCYSFIFAKAIEYIKGNYMKTIAIADIANYANTTVRNLQYKFNQQMALTPLQFLRCYRLYQFHRTLAFSKTVESAAFACGFRHMGRVSLHYKDVYGLSPSQYLRSTKSTNFFSWLSTHPSKDFIE